jgi:hypothetical protein
VVRGLQGEGVTPVERNNVCAGLLSNLNTLTLTAPVTVLDTIDLKNLIRAWCIIGVIDVHSPNGKRVFVTVDVEGQRVEKVYDAI